MPLTLLLLLIIGVLIGVAFFTLFERKLLGYIQLRKGPNKTGLTGILQPFADAIKLFCKEHINPQDSNYLIFLLAPVISFGLSLLVWVRVPSQVNFLTFDIRILFFLCCVGLGVYLIFAAGWRSNSKYALFGALRGVAQTISYEVSLVLILIAPLLILIAYDWNRFIIWQKNCWFISLFPFRFIIWLISCLAETNRTPFDFAEGESELVSGYNTEYSRGGFALLILSEYTSILFISFLIMVIFFGGYTSFMGWIIFITIAFVFVWVRGTLPRYRYDKLITLAWIVLLPFSLNLLIFVSRLIL